MLFSQTIVSIDSEITALLAQVEAKKQRQSQLLELDTLTDNTLGQLGDVVSNFRHYAPETIASLKSAVLTLFDSGDDRNDGGNQPTDTPPDTDPALSTQHPTPDSDEVEDVNFIDEDSLEYPTMEGQCCHIEQELEFYWERLAKPEGQAWEFATPIACLLWEDALMLGQACTVEFFQAETLSRGSRFWFGAPDNTGTVLESLGNGEYKVQIDGAIGEVMLDRHHCHYIVEPLTGQTCDIDKAPLTGQHCTITLSSAEAAGESGAYCELVKVSERVAYQRQNDGQIICTYIGFNNKARAKSWANYLEAMTSRIELRAAKRLGDWKHELKLWNLSIKQIERLAAENLDKMPLAKEPSLPPTYKPQPIPQPVNPEEIETGDIVTALLTPGASYRVEQVMPNGILDCTNLTTGDRLGLRPGAVSLVQKAEQPEVTQQVIDFEPKPDAPTKYARVKLKGDRFDGQVFAVVKGNELGSTLLTPNGHHWFHSDCLVFIDPDAQTTTGNYKGLSKQMKRHWEKVGINPSDLIADMKANRPPEPEWNAANYNPIQRDLAAVGADDASDF